MALRVKFNQKFTTETQTLKQLTDRQINQQKLEPKLLDNLPKQRAFLPSIERRRQSKQRTQSHRHEQGAEDCHHSSQSQTPLRLHHVNLTCREGKRIH